MTFPAPEILMIDRLVANRRTLGARIAWIAALALPLVLAACNNGGSGGPGY
ncbi:MAG TPA: hypothetical protein VFS32_02880 [Candidatus Limnocylindrales bacterium]|nr:hypothetical protein [Candidatus Limnocylindrales bacterium]